jgi:hypothetical protein
MKGRTIALNTTPVPLRSTGEGERGRSVIEKYEITAMQWLQERTQNN